MTAFDRPEIPLHTKGSERGIRLHVTRLTISGDVQATRGRDCRICSWLADCILEGKRPDYCPDCEQNRLAQEKMTSMATISCDR